MRRLLGFLVLLTFILGGCGGSGGGSQKSVGTGRVRFVVQWPAGRDIPSNTRSLRVRAFELAKQDDGSFVVDDPLQNKVVGRPEGQSETEVVLENLPSVRVRLVVTAHEQTDGSGEALAAGQADVDITSGATENVTIDLSAEIVKVETDPKFIGISTGQTKTVEAVALNSGNGVVPIDSSRWEFSTLDTTVIQIAQLPAPNQNQVQVTGLVAGSATVTVRDKTTGFTFQMNVGVTPPGIPGYMALEFRGSLTLSGFGQLDGTREEAAFFDLSDLDATNPADRGIDFDITSFSNIIRLKSFTASGFTAFVPVETDDEQLEQVPVTGTITEVDGVITVQVSGSGFGRSGTYSGVATGID